MSDAMIIVTNLEENRARASLLQKWLKMVFISLL
jgi:hypothetical protein